MYAAASANSLSQRTRQLFPEAPLGIVTTKSSGDAIHEANVARRKRWRYGETEQIVSNLVAGQQPQHQEQKPQQAIVLFHPNQDNMTESSQSSALQLPPTKRQQQLAPWKSPSETTPGETRILVKKSSSVNIPTPKWHPPWKLATVLSSHLGWVRSIALDPVENRWMATGSADRTIKVWDFPKASVGASDALCYTLTGHISAVRGLAFSDRHPYLFSCGEDKQVKCWDLETNQVVRHYHGHLSGIFCLALHPTVDVLVTGGRDAVARVWDIRTKQQVHCLSGHHDTVGAVLTKSVHPQVITASQDCTIKLWDLVAGKCFTTLTHHAKGVRALTQPSFEHSFVSGAADMLKKWQGKDGRFLSNYTGHDRVINALAVNEDGVLVSGADDGSLRFWDYGTGYEFQSAQAAVQPGSLDSENSIMALSFDGTGTRLITGEGDKTIKIWKPDEEASELSHPVDITAWRKKCIAQAKQRY